MSFDAPLSRQNTYSLKWDKYAGQDILPLWVADADFTCAPPILEALQTRIEHGVLGYTKPEQYTPAIQAVQRWLLRQHQWQIEQDWLVWMPGVVPAFNVACQAFCQSGDKVIVQTPNYPPLLAAPALNGLERLTFGSVLEEGRWTINFAELEQQAAQPGARLLILCNPMNPNGSVLTEQELLRIADICQRHDLILCSDEIHCDLILDEQATHIPAAKIAALQARSLCLMAASKTFNVAGLGTAFAVIPNAELRAKFNRAAAGTVPWVTILGLVATEAAFTLCDQWHQSLLHYLRGNRDYLCQQINAFAGLQVIPPQATFLAWVDASGLAANDVQHHFEAKGVGPSPGADFGAPNFVRLNFACPRAQLEAAVARLG